MSNILEVECKVKIYEINGDESGIIPAEDKLIVRSHWSRRNLVVIKFCDKEITIDAGDLSLAVQNATRLA